MPVFNVAHLSILYVFQILWGTCKDFCLIKISIIWLLFKWIFLLLIFDWYWFKSLQDMSSVFTFFPDFLITFQYWDKPKVYQQGNTLKGCDRSSCMGLPIKRSELLTCTITWVNHKIRMPTEAAMPKEEKDVYTLCGSASKKPRRSKLICRDRTRKHIRVTWESRAAGWVRGRSPKGMENLEDWWVCPLSRSYC